MLNIKYLIKTFKSEHFINTVSRKSIAYRVFQRRFKFICFHLITLYLQTWEFYWQHILYDRASHSLFKRTLVITFKSNDNNLRIETNLNLQPHLHYFYTHTRVLIRHNISRIYSTRWPKDATGGNVLYSSTFRIWLLIRTIILHRLLFVRTNRLSIPVAKEFFSNKSV